MVNDNEKELKERVKEIVTKMLLNGDKKEIIAFSDFELWKFGEINEDYTGLKEDKKKLIDYEEIIKETKLKILETLKGE